MNIDLTKTKKEIIEQIRESSEKVQFMDYEVKELLKRFSENTVSEFLFEAFIKNEYFKIKEKLDPIQAKFSIVKKKMKNRYVGPEWEVYLTSPLFEDKIPYYLINAFGQIFEPILSGSGASVMIGKKRYLSSWNDNPNTMPQIKF